MFEWRPGVPMLAGPPDVELPILMDAPDDYARGEDFDGPIIQDILPVVGDHLTFDDGGNVIPEEPVRAHDIIPIEDNDFIDNEYDAMMPHINTDVPADVPMPQ